MTDEERRLEEVAEALAEALVPTVQRLIRGLTDEEALAAARRIVARRLQSEAGLMLPGEFTRGDQDTGPRRVE